MIEVTFRFAKGRHHMTMDGHAGFNPGNDVVCAAASALAYTMLGALSNLSNSIEYTAESGRVEVTAPDGAEARTIVMTFIIGFLQLEAAQPKNVKVGVIGYKKIASTSSFLQKRMVT